MAKVPFTKLGLSKNQNVKTIEWNSQIIEIKQYLSIAEKLQIISNVLNYAHDEYNFANPVKVKVYTALEILYAYTNINFTDKQKEDAVKLYDLCFSNGLLAAIIKEIPENEYATLVQDITETINAIYTYRNSVMGILETAVNDYGAVSLDASEIQQKLADPNNMTLLKDILDKLA